jgi:hypothetical protein
MRGEYKLAALEMRHGAGAKRLYSVTQQKQILATVRRQPDREQDGTATSIFTLHQALSKENQNFGELVILLEFQPRAGESPSYRFVVAIANLAPLI